MRKTRKNNLIVHGIKESNSQATEERKEHDLQVLKDIAATCKVNIDEFKSNKLVRLGKSLTRKGQLDQYQYQVIILT